MVIASGAGGGYDVYARVLAAHMADHIPGHPSLSPKTCPAPAGMVAINWAYNAAPKDGSVILSSFNVILEAALFGDKQAKFDPRKFASIGSIGKQQNICATWYTSPIKTLDQAKEQEVTVSAEGVNSNSATLPLILNSMLGTKFKVITGYSTEGMRLARNVGRSQGLCGLSWTTLKASNPDWVANHRLNILVQTGEKAQAGFARCAGADRSRVEPRGQADPSPARISGRTGPPVPDAARHAGQYGRRSSARLSRRR